MFKLFGPVDHNGNEKFRGIENLWDWGECKKSAFKKLLIAENVPYFATT